MASNVFATAPDRKVIVDAGIVIRGERFDRFGKEFFTTEAVFHEIRDQQARRNLQHLPVELKIREPEKQDWAFVRKFAKETGDFGSLSTNDMGLMALAVMLHREGGVGKELRSSPEVAGVLKKSVPFSWAPQSCDGSSLSAGPAASSRPSISSGMREFDPVTFSDDDGEGAWEGEVSDDEGREEAVDAAFESGRKGAGRGGAEASASSSSDPCCTPEKSGEEKELVEEPKTDVKELAEHVKALEIIAEEDDEEKEDQESSVGGPPHAQKPKILCAAFNHNTVVNDTEENEESDNDDGWVTVENIRRLNNVVEGEGDEEEELPGTVAIASTDYSVQNVSIQMGLKALSCDGFRIRNVKMWGKICRGCFHSTRETEKIFCPKCGNATLDRVPITLDAEGRMIVHDGRRRKRNLRGTIYNIPKYKGGHGRATKNIMLAEDEIYIGGRDRQIKYQQKLAEKQRMINDPFANDTLDGWCARHVTGTGRTVNSNPHQVVHGFGRKNPNSNNFRQGKFKKK